MKMSTFVKTVVAVFLMGLMPCLSVTAGDGGGIKLLKENFEYPTGSALVKNGTWANFEFMGTSSRDSIRIAEGGLAYPGYQTAAVGNSVHLGEVGYDATMKFSPQAGVIYASMLVNVKAASTSTKGDFIFSFGDITNSTVEGFARLYIKKFDDKFGFGIARREMNDPGSYMDTKYNYNTTYLIVVKYTPDATNGKVELFVNPDITGAEPASLLSSTVGTNTTKAFRYVNLYQGKKEGNDVTVDAMRVATSWETLFDASPVVKFPYIDVPTVWNLGDFKQGNAPVNRTFTVKGENLPGDITVSCKTTGYFTLATNTIPKADAESAKGYTFKATLNPADGKVTSDELTLTSGTSTSTVKMEWSYILPPPELEAENIGIINKASKESFYTLVNPVTVTDVAFAGNGLKYTIKDASGSAEFYDYEMSLIFENVALGSVLTKLRLQVQNGNIEGAFEPLFVLADSPEILVVPGEPTGVKLFDEVFDYEEVGNLADKGDWKAFNYFDQIGGDPVKLVNRPLQFFPYQNTPQGLAVELNGQGGDAYAKFPGVGGTVYASMLVSVSEASEAGDYFFAFNISDNGGPAPASSGGYGMLCVKKVGGKLAFGVTQNIPDADRIVYSAAEYNFNEPILLVVKYFQGPQWFDDYAELFVNPENIMGAEPKSTLKTKELGMEPYANLKFVELLQYNENGTNYKLDVDAIRVATNWPSLFDQSQVELAPEIITEQGGVINLGSFEQGAENVEPVVLNIKAKNLRSDLTIKGTTEGYYTLSTTSIKKEDAESENGVNINITLNPKDGKVMKDVITVSGTLVNYKIYADWDYSARGNKNTLAELKEVKEKGIFTLVNQVYIEAMEDTGDGRTFLCTLKDDSGTLGVYHTKGGAQPRAKATLDDIKAGKNVRNLCIMVSSFEEEFNPEYDITESPNLEVTESSINVISNGSVTGYVNGQFIAEGAKNIKVFDVNGKCLLEANGEILSMNELPNAMYVVQFADEAGKVYTTKVVK